MAALNLQLRRIDCLGIHQVMEHRNPISVCNPSVVLSFRIPTSASNDIILQIVQSKRVVYYSRYTVYTWGVIVN